MEDHGTVFETRFKLMRERIEAMTEIWTKSKAECHGDMVDFPEMMTWPKPVQKALSADPGRRRLPAGPHAVPSGMATAGARSAAPDRACSTWWRNTDRGRAMPGAIPQSVPVTLFNPAEDESELARYRDMGVARVVPMLLSEERDKILPVLDRWVELIRRTAY